MSKRHRHERKAEKVPTARWLDPQSDVPWMLDKLRLVRAAHAEIDQLQDQWVHGLLACGVGYSEIAAALGVSRQVVHRRYANTVHAAKVHSDGAVSWVAMGTRHAASERGVSDR